VVLGLFGFLGGILAFGFIGVFLGPTLLAVGYSLFLEWHAAEVKDRRHSKSERRMLLEIFVRAQFQLLWKIGNCKIGNCSVSSYVRLASIMMRTSISICRALANGRPHF
jgi:hypothetical protein